MPELAIGPEETSRHISMPVGETLTLRLAENPTTGFRWVVETLSSQVVELSHSRFSTGQGGGMGGGGERIFDFRSLKTGSAIIALNLQREWASAAPERRVQISVEVR